MPKKALYAGSFDPVTMGHLDIIRRAAKLCDELVVGIIRNPQKSSMFTEEERFEMIKLSTSDLPNVRVDAFSGLLADYVNSNDFDIVIRGLRGTTDFDSEIQMAQLHSILYNDKVETVFLMTSPEYSFISSSMVKEVYLLDGNVDRLVSREVLEFMNSKFSK
ncbi:MAG: pantetheine-phosphate adenylyltransferase [Anaerovoracaceae bacterium]|nr:pantetheine-phosphate adenylyltransferase [Anaerovoracaceae bacterium]